MNISIVNYGLGNIGSVCNAVNALGYSVKVCNKPSEIRKTTWIILPGVGAFGRAMATLEREGWVEELGEQVLHQKKPFLGICLGMQLLASQSEEYGNHKGLNWIPGKVTRFQENNLPVPHVGWNDIEIAKPGVLFRDLPKSVTPYFVHSFCFFPEDAGVITASCQYGEKFVASLEKDNIVATQFHPERSQSIGLKVLSNFLERGTKR